jgi:hypothetical protein
MAKENVEESTKAGVEDMLENYTPAKAADIKKADEDDTDTDDKKKDTDDKKKDDDKDLDTDVDDKDEDEDTDEDEDDDDEEDGDEDEDADEDDDEEGEDDDEDEEEDEEDDDKKKKDAKKTKKKPKEHSALADIIANIREGTYKKGKDTDDKDEDEEEEEPEKKPVKKGKTYDLISQEVLDKSEGVLTAEMLNEFGTSIINAAIQGSLRATPLVVGKQIKRQRMFDNLVDAFYTDNEDLLKHKPYVSFTAGQLASKHPDWDETKIFENLASASRKGLGIKEQARKVEDKRTKKKPALPDKTRTKRRRKGNKDDKRTPIQQDIDTLMD